MAKTKPLPSDIEAEKSVLSAMLQNEKAAKKCKAVLIEADFYLQSHAQLFAAISHMACPLDPVTLGNELKRMELFDKVGAPGIIFELYESASTVAGWPYHLKIIKEKAARRAIILHGSKFIQSAYADHEDLQEILSQAKSFFRTCGTEERKEPSNRDLYYQLYDSLSNGQEPGIGLGIPGLEGFYLEPSYISCLAAESGVGKSAWLLQASDHVARTYGRVLYFSLESTQLYLAKRRLAGLSQIPLTRINKGNIRYEAGEWEIINKCCNELSTIPLQLIDFDGFTIEQIISYCESACIDNDIRLIVIDFLQLIYSSKIHGSRHLEISYIVQQFKHLAKELNVPVLFASQLRKDVQGRPKLDDLKESGDIRTHTDNIIFIYALDSHPAEYEVQCFLGKGKEQEYFETWLHFNGHFQRFTQGVEPDNATSRKHWKNRN